MKIGKAVNNVLEIPSHDQQTESENTLCDLDSSTSETKPSEPSNKTLHGTVM